MSDTSLVFNVLARDRASSVFRKIRNSAEETGASLKTALGPALMPILAASTAGIAGVGAALASVGAAAGVFGAVFKSSFTEVQEASNKTADLTDKVALLDQRIKVAQQTGVGDAGKLEKARANALNELMARYNQMPPALRQVTQSYDGMKASWKGFVDQNKPATYGLMSGGMNLISANIKKLQPLYDVGAAAAKKFVDAATRWAGGGGVERMVAFLSANAVPAFDSLGRIAKNVATTVGKFLGSFSSNGQGILAWLAEASDKMAAWATATDGSGLQSFIDKVQATGPKVVGLLNSLSSTAVTIAKAVSPLAPVSLAIAGALGSIIAALPPAVITALVAAWVAYGVALKGYHAYTVLVGAATKIWAGIQWLLNVAMTANPIGLVVLAIVALIAIIVLIATKTTWFQTLWKYIWDKGIKAAALATWRWIKSAALAFWNWIKAVPGWIRDKWNTMWSAVKSAAGTAWTWIKTKVTAVTNWLKDLPGRIGKKLSSMWDGLKSGFKAAVNWVIGKWNNLSFGIPSFSFAGRSFPGITIGTPDIPYLAKGGTVQRAGTAVVGERGPELVSLSRGAQVTPLKRGAAGGRGQTVRIEVVGDREVAAFLRRMIRTANLLQS